MASRSHHIWTVRDVSESGMRRRISGTARRGHDHRKPSRDGSVRLPLTDAALSGPRSARVPAGEHAQSHDSWARSPGCAPCSPLHCCYHQVFAWENAQLVTTTDSANITPNAGRQAAVQTAEHLAARPAAAVLAERRARLVLWVAFATFCALVFAAIKFGVDYVSTAEIDQGARITASRGQVVFSLPGSGDKTLLGGRTELGVGTILALDRSSVASADLQFFD